MNKKKVELSEFEAFTGEHCETVATGTLLKRIGLDLPEPMIFGLGQGLAFVFLNLAGLPLPFVGGRVKPFALTQALCINLGLDLHVSETTSKSKAWSRLEDPLVADIPVGLQLDSFYLEYFSHPVHFAGHFVAAFGFDDESVLLVDTSQQGGQVRSSISSVEQARFARGPMSARARTWTISGDAGNSNIREAAVNAIKANAVSYLQPAFKGASHYGIQKLTASLPEWLEISNNPEDDFKLASDLMERAGTGGSIFRAFYRDFLREIQAELPGSRVTVRKAEALFGQSAENWTAIALKLNECGKTQNAALLGEAAALCNMNAEIERSAMEVLAAI